MLSITCARMKTKPSLARQSIQSCKRDVMGGRDLSGGVPPMEHEASVDWLRNRRVITSGTTGRPSPRSTAATRKTIPRLGGWLTTQLAKVFKELHGHFREFMDAQ